MVMSVVPSVVSFANPSIASKLATYLLATVASFFSGETPSSEQPIQFESVDTSQKEGGHETDAQMRKGLGGGGEPTAPSTRAKGKSSSKDVVDRSGSQEGTEPYEKQSQGPQGYSQAGPDLNQPIPIQTQAGTDPDDAPQHTGRGSSSGGENSSPRHKSGEVEAPR